MGHSVSRYVCSFTPLTPLTRSTCSLTHSLHLLAHSFAPPAHSLTHSLKEGLKFILKTWLMGTTCLHARSLAYSLLKIHSENAIDGNLLCLLSSVGKHPMTVPSTPLAHFRRSKNPAKMLLLRTTTTTKTKTISRTKGCLTRFGCRKAGGTLYLIAERVVRNRGETCCDHVIW